MTAGEGDAVVLGAANFARYAPWIELVDSLDANAAAALYKRLYPQFQSAYENLGNPDGYFNDRVVEVIDHLLSAPEAPATISLVRPNVYYEFADPALEGQSAGRKLLLRMGPGNAARVKAKLREIRAAHRDPAQAALAGRLVPLEDFRLDREQEHRFAPALARAGLQPAHRARSEIPARLAPLDQPCGHLAEGRLVADGQHGPPAFRPAGGVEQRGDVAAGRDALDGLERTAERARGFLRAARRRDDHAQVARAGAARGSAPSARPGAGHAR